MKWTPGVLALVTAAVFVALVGIGVAYVVHQDSDQVSGRSRTASVEHAGEPDRRHAVGGPTPSALPAQRPGRRSR